MVGCRFKMTKAGRDRRKKRRAWNQAIKNRFTDIPWRQPTEFWTPSMWAAIRLQGFPLVIHHERPNTVATMTFKENQC
jgi:hypothetical protein